MQIHLIHGVLLLSLYILLLYILHLINKRSTDMYGIKGKVRGIQGEMCADEERAIGR